MHGQVVHSLIPQSIVLRGTIPKGGSSFVGRDCVVVKVYFGLESILSRHNPLHVSNGSGQRYWVWSFLWHLFVIYWVKIFVTNFSRRRMTSMCHEDCFDRVTLYRRRVLRHIVVWQRKSRHVQDVVGLYCKFVFSPFYLRNSLRNFDSLYLRTPCNIY